MNAPRGIMQFNEKLFAYRSEHATPSFVGTEIELARHFIKNLKHFPQYVILKPMDLFSGIGVEKLSIEKWEERFMQKTKELSGPVIIQPFINEVSQGEIRSIYFKGVELGSILKIPKEGEFLSNIAQGASFIPYELSRSNRRLCENVAEELAGHGVDWIAFDILGDSLQEVNVTCPGLLVEVSFALKENLALKMINMI
jgi:glutathione synthase